MTIPACPQDPVPGRRNDACGGHAGYPSRVPWDGRGVEIPRGRLIRSGPPPTRASV